MSSCSKGSEIASKGLAAQLPRNLTANIVYFLVNILIGLLLVPYFISTLGVAAYGIIPLATSITGYVAIVVQSLNTAISRFLTVDLQRGDYEAANRTFNTALFGLTAIILAMAPIVLLISYLAPSLFNIPVGQSQGAVLLFLGVSVAFLIRSWSGNFTVQLFAFNRLDLQNVVNLVNLVVQTGLIVLLFTLSGPSLGFVGIAYLVGAMVASMVSIIFARRVCPHLHISMQSFDRTRVKDLGGMGWWVIINQVGALLFLQIDLIVVNLLFGDLMAGEYAVALQWSILMRAIAGVLSGVLTPTIFHCYAAGNSNTLIRVVKSAVKLLGLAMALPVGLVCGLAPQVLTAWVGEELVFLAPLLIILTIHLTINLSVLPLFSINVAHNRVRIPGIITFIMGIGNFGLAIALPLITGWGYYGVAIAGAIILTLKNALFIPWYATKILHVEGHTFTRSIFSGVLATAVIGLTATALSMVLPLGALLILIVVGGTITIGYVISIAMFGLDDFEREIFGSYIPRSLRRFLA